MNLQSETGTMFADDNPALLFRFAAEHEEILYQGVVLSQVIFDHADEFGATIEYNE